MVNGHITPFRGSHLSYRSGCFNNQIDGAGKGNINSSGHNYNKYPYDRVSSNRITPHTHPKKRHGGGGHNNRQGHVTGKCRQAEGRLE